MRDREPFEFVWDEEGIPFVMRAQAVREQGLFTVRRVGVFARMLARFAPPPPARIL